MVVGRDQMGWGCSKRGWHAATHRRARAPPPQEPRPLLGSACCLPSVHTHTHSNSSHTIDYCVVAVVARSLHMSEKCFKKKKKEKRSPPFICIMPTPLASFFFLVGLFPCTYISVFPQRRSPTVCTAFKLQRE
jgi:hypothetical protein